jgi:hypothetical protein
MDEPSPGGLRVSKGSYDYIRPTWDAIGSMVIGRHLFDMTNGWEGRPPAGEHVVVASHRPKPEGWHDLPSKELSREHKSSRDASDRTRCQH